MEMKRYKNYFLNIEIPIHLFTYLSTIRHKSKITEVCTVCCEYFLKYTTLFKYENNDNLKAFINIIMMKTYVIKKKNVFENV